jgi:ferredoxin-type protein NapH
MQTRRWTQIAGTLAANPWFAYIGTRAIYQGRAKGVCFPGFNCYACPLALMSCPIGSLQHSFATMSPQGDAAAGVSRQAAAVVHHAQSFSISAFLYVVGFIGIIGAVFGRLVCGWVCPFGLLQDLLYKIPSPKLRIPRWARFGKYATLVILAMLIPYITGVHWFSRLCPAGSLEGAVPLKLLPPKTPLPPVGWFFWLKMGILVAFLLWMVASKRPFCRTACPLGAMYALLNPVSLYRMRVDYDMCDKCGACRDVCPVDINIYDNANSPECIRCLECKKACPNGAITSGFRLDRTREPGAALSE